MSSALAVEGRFTVCNFLKKWVETGALSYKFSVHENTLEPQRVRATFSKPTPHAPAAAAVAHLYFRLDEGLHTVLGFTVESETHFHSVKDLRFDEAILDHVIRRKLVLKQQQLVNLSDEFSSTRVPALMKEQEEKKRDRDREALEEYVLEQFQRKDPYNDGRLAFHECRDVLFGLDLPHISRRDREILFAFVELDRDDMVDYSALVSIGAEVLDTLLHTQPLNGSSKKDDKGKEDVLDDSIECFHALVKYRQFFTMDKLAQVLDAFHPVAPTAVAAVEATTDDTGETMVDDEGTASTEIEEGECSEATENTADATSTTDTPAPPVERVITRRQLRTSLESPQLLLSRAEINLIAALATTTPAGQIPCDQLNELLQHVQTLIFHYQTRCFADARLAQYVLQQFISYESSHLTGSAEHLKQRLRQRDIKAVVKDMKKLLLSPYQVSRLVELCEDSAVDPNHVVSYKACVPRVIAWLENHVDPHELHALATAVHALHQSSADVGEPLPEEGTVRHSAIEAFEAMDEKRSGVLLIGDFHASLTQLARVIDSTALDDPVDVAAITVLADPMGQGRVNYIYFLQLLYPVLRWLQHEKRVATVRRNGSQRRADAKAIDEEDEESTCGAK